jgi:hypothetical protein
MGAPFWDNTEGAFSQYFAQIADASAWDTAILGGRRLPGLVKVEGEPGRNIDVNTTPGSDGATIIDKGYAVAKPTIKVTIWTPQQWDDLQAILAIIAPKPGKSSKKPPPAVPLVHPGANAVGINAVLIVGTPILQHVGKGVHEMSIKCVQWLKPKKMAYGPPPQFNIPTEGAVEAAPPTLPSGTPLAKGPS